MKLLGLSNNFLKNIFIHVSWILKPQKAVDLAQKIMSEIEKQDDKKQSIIAIGYLNEFFSKYLEFGKSAKEIILLNQKVDDHKKTDNKILNALIELRDIRLKIKKYNADKQDQIIPTTKSFGISAGKVNGEVLNIISTKQSIPQNCIGIFPTAGAKYDTQFLKCKGIIFKNGGMTSHGAILAREFKIPAIVSPHTKLTDKTIISIDGSTGEIKIVDIGN